MTFASAGHPVSIYDVDTDKVCLVLKEIQDEFLELERSQSLRGELTAGQQIALINGESSLRDAIEDAVYIQECVPENVEMKLKVLQEIDGIIGTDSIVASSTSSIETSKLSATLNNKERFIVVNPVNPPYFIPVVEIVVAPWTNPETIDKTKSLMKDIGQKPITSKKPDVFPLGRLQNAVFNESWRLVGGGYLNAEDVDTVMTEGLGRRYAFIGAFETAHLNAEGMANYLERYNETVFNVAKDLGGPPSLSGPVRQEIEIQLEERIPLDDLVARRKWRDHGLAELMKIRAEF